MKVQWHAATALPFLLLGDIAGAIACVAPDAPWLEAERRYRKWRGAAPVMNERTWYDWLRDARFGFGALPSWVLVTYRLTHSPFMLLLFASMCAGWAWSGQHAAPWGVVAGWTIHLLLDIFTHDGPLRMLWWYPLLRNPETDAVPARWIHPAFAIDRERGLSDMVALSGGWESALCLARAVERSRRTGVRVRALFVMYGQEGEEGERRAATDLCAMFGVLLHADSIYSPIVATTGEGRHVFFARNSAIVLRAIQIHAGAASVRAVWMGYRAPFAVFDEYGDSNRGWARDMERWYGVPVVSPCVAWPKWMVKRAVLRAGIRRSWIYSSEV